VETPLARWKDLCIDAGDAARVGEFWGRVLGLRWTAHGDGDGQLDDPGGDKGRRVWVNAVPEPKSVKNRVHIDVRTGSVQPLLDLGASVVTPPPPDHDAWWVLADPEGAEFCASVRPDFGLSAGWYELVVDCVDARAQSRWWADVLGANVSPDDGNPWSAVEGIAGFPFDYLVFNPVTEQKTVKNRVHWDVTADGVQPLLDRGATRVTLPHDEVTWTVLADPEGNEFCVFVSA